MERGATHNKLKPSPFRFRRSTSRPLHSAPPTSTSDMLRRSDLPSSSVFNSIFKLNMLLGSLPFKFTTTPRSAFLHGIHHVTTSPTTPSTLGSFQQPAGTSTSTGPSQPPLLLSQPSGNEAPAAELPGGPPPDGSPNDGPPSDSDWTPPHSASSDIHQKLVIRVK